jgi:hypothetical protein
VYLKTNHRQAAIADLQAEQAERQPAIEALRGSAPTHPIPPESPVLPSMPAILDLDEIPRPSEAPKQPPALDISELPAYRHDENPMMIAAPPTRAGTGMPGSYFGKQRVRLSAEESELCRLAGLDPVTYAQGKLRLEKEKREGLRQNG